MMGLVFIASIMELPLIMVSWKILLTKGTQLYHILGSRVAFLEPGTYNYKCPNNIIIEQGQFVVVSSQHKILLCDNCTNNLTIEVDDVVYWTRYDIECSLSLVDANCSDSPIATFDYAQGKALCGHTIIPIVRL